MAKSIIPEKFPAAAPAGVGQTTTAKVIPFHQPVQRGKGIGGFSASLICALAQLSRQDLWFTENIMRATLRMGPLPTPAYIVWPHNKPGAAADKPVAQ